MSKLTTKERAAIPKDKFALPMERKYPIENPAHAIAAKSRATQQFDKGNLSKSSKMAINMKANRVLKGSKRGG